MHPNSKIAKENLEVFADMWQWLASDVNAISKEIIEMVQALTKPDRTEYLSLPRPGVRINLYSTRHQKYSRSFLMFSFINRNTVPHRNP